MGVASQQNYPTSRPHPAQLAILARRTRSRRRPVLMGTMGVMNGDVRAEVTALAINVTIPEALRWTDTRRGERVRCVAGSGPGLQRLPG